MAVEGGGEESLWEVEWDCFIAPGSRTRDITRVHAQWVEEREEGGQKNSAPSPLRISSIGWCGEIERREQLASSGESGAGCHGVRYGEAGSCGYLYAAPVTPPRPASGPLLENLDEKPSAGVCPSLPFNIPHITRRGHRERARIYSSSSSRFYSRGVLQIAARDRCYSML